MIAAAHLDVSREVRAMLLDELDGLRRLFASLSLLREHEQSYDGRPVLVRLGLVEA